MEYIIKTLTEFLHSPGALMEFIFEGMALSLTQMKRLSSELSYQIFHRVAVNDWALIFEFC